MPLLLMGFGLLVVFCQSPAFQFGTVPPAPATDGPAVPTGQPAGSGLALPNYDPAVNNAAFNTSASDERPGWLVSGQLVLALLVVIGLIYVVIAGLRWLQQGRRGLAQKSAAIRVLETIGLAQGRALHLIVAGNKTLLIGSTDHQVSLLAELPDAVLPVPEEDAAAFEKAMSRAEGARKPSPEWQSALDSLQAGVRWIRQSGGDRSE
jgi:flagellar biogenesis protein FliO